MSDTSGQLSKSVECNWDGCKNRTLDASLHCIHHRRSRTFRTTTQYKAHDTSRAVNRAHSVMSAVSNPSHPDNQLFTEIYRSNNVLMAAYPELRVYGDRDIRIINAFGPERNTLEYDGQRYAILPGEQVDLGSAIAVRTGNDVNFVPTSTESNLDDARESVIKARKAAWVNNYCAPGAIDGIAGEEYDDVAEAFAQINLLGRSAAGITVTYIGRENGIGLRIHDENTDTEEMWSYEIGGMDNIGAEVISAADGEYVLIHDNAQFNDERSYIKQQLHGGDSVTRHADDADVFHRDTELTRIRTAMNTVSKFGFIQDGKLRLPVGWNSRERVGM